MHSMRWMQMATMTLALAAYADASVVVLDITGQVSGGSVTVSLHDDFLGIEYCGGTCNAPVVCFATVACQAAESPATIADALAAQFMNKASCQAISLTAIANPGVPGRLMLAWPDNIELNVCIDGGQMHDRIQCCPWLTATSCGTFTCSETTPVPYCTAGVSASGCLAGLTVDGNASATASAGFFLEASTFEGLASGLFFFGTNGRQANPWGTSSSLQCVVPPVKRTSLRSAGGVAGLCNGNLTEDLNARWCPGCPKPGQNPGAGATVQAQLWYRDPLNTSNQTTSLSSAVEFDVGP
jgi:hypothetical protein